MIFHRMTSIMYTVSEEPDVPEGPVGHLHCKGKEVYKLKDIQRYCKTKILAQPIPVQSGCCDDQGRKDHGADWKYHRGRRLKQDDQFH